MNRAAVFIFALACFTCCAQQKPAARNRDKCDAWNGAYHTELEGPGWRCDPKQGWHIDEEAKKIDEASLKACMDDESKKADLVKRARTAILSDKEFDELYSDGYSILVPMTCSYGGGFGAVTNFSEVEWQKNFDELLAQQFRLRVIKETGGK